MTAIKRSENGKGDVIRAVEVQGKETQTSIYGAMVRGEIHTTFSPYEIKTFLKEDDADEWREVLLSEFED